MRYTLLTGSEIKFHADIESVDTRGLNVWCTQICPGLRGVESLKDAREATEAGIFLYHRLKTAPDFRIAHVGWDRDNCAGTPLSDFIDTKSDGKKHWYGYECVMDDKLYKKLGSPVEFWQFREGYLWRKYRGETYTPLFSDDQNELVELCEQLLPGNFEHAGSVR